MMSENPLAGSHREALKEAFSLIHRHGIIWGAVALATYVFSFHILPQSMALEEGVENVQAKREKILALVEKIEQLETTRKLAQEQDPFYMERMIRETFRVKKKSPLNDPN